MAAITDTVKRVPRWTWYTIGGVAVGSGALRLWKSRTTADGDTPLAADGSSVETSGTYDYGAAGVSGSPAGVIVPPVIMPSGSDSGVSTELTQLYMGGVSDLLGQFGSLFAQDQTHYQDWVAAYQGGASGLLQQQGQAFQQTFDALAGGGSPPTPLQPAAVQTDVAQGAPTVAVAAAQPTTSRAASCNDLFNGYGHHNPANGAPSRKSCFYNKCNEKGTEDHYYADGHVVHDGDKCSPKGRRW